MVVAPSSLVSMDSARLVKLGDRQPTGNDPDQHLRGRRVVACTGEEIGSVDALLTRDGHASNPSVEGWRRGGSRPPNR